MLLYHIALYSGTSCDGRRPSYAKAVQASARLALRLVAMTASTLYGQNIAHQRSTPQRSSWIFSCIFQWNFSDMFQWMCVFVICGV